jgi:hypothetical protein
MAQTRSALVTYVTDKFGDTSTAMVTRAKGFYDARYAMIQDRYFWKQMKVSESTSVASGTQDITFTNALDLITVVSWADIQLSPVNQEQVFQIDPSANDGEGTPVSFSVLPKTDAGLPRIRLYRVPTETKTLIVIGKAPTETLSDSESPRLTGIDQALHGYVLGDMWEHKRQYTKASACFQEAEAFLQKMIDIEEDQGANSARIIPSDAHQWDREDVGF